MDINFTLVMQAVAFAAFIWFTAKFVWPPLMRAIETSSGSCNRERMRASISSSARLVVTTSGSRLM